MNRAFLSLGSNLGDSRAWLSRAAQELAAAPGICGLIRSPLYQSEPWGYPDQPWFHNGAVAVTTTCAPRELLALCQSIEAAAGRERKIRWGPRTLDIDIISMDNIILNTRELMLPHPRYKERRFVLQPLADLLGNSTPPPLENIGELLARCPERPLVKRVCLADDW